MLSKSVLYYLEENWGQKVTEFCAMEDLVGNPVMILVANQALSPESHLLTLHQNHHWALYQVCYLLQVRLSQNEFMKSSIFRVIFWKIDDFINPF